MPAAASSSPTAAQQLLAEALRAASAQQGVSWDVSTCNGPTRQSCAGGPERVAIYVGPNGASEKVALPTKAGTLQVQFLLSKRLLYMNGNAGGLYDCAPFPPHVAAAESGKWLAVAASSPAFRQIELRMQLQDAINPLVLGASTLSLLPPMRLAGQVAQRLRETAVQGVDALTTVVWLAPSHLPLQIETTTHDASAQGLFPKWSSQVMSYSRWSQTVPIRIPVRWRPVQPAWVSPHLQGAC